jgi:hypothetical protein
MDFFYQNGGEPSLCIEEMHMAFWLRRVYFVFVEEWSGLLLLRGVGLHGQLL